MQPKGSEYKRVLLPCRHPVCSAAWMRWCEYELKSSKRSTHLPLHPTPSFLLQIIPSKPATFPSPTKNRPELKTAKRNTKMARKQFFFFKKKNPQERPRRLLQISCQKNICLTLELHAREIKGNLFVLCNQTLEKCLLYFSSSFENYLDTLCPALFYPLY